MDSIVKMLPLGSIYLLPLHKTSTTNQSSVKPMIILGEQMSLLSSYRTWVRGSRQGHGYSEAPGRSAPSREDGSLAAQMDSLHVKLLQPTSSILSLRTPGPYAIRTEQLARYSGESSMILLTAHM